MLANTSPTTTDYHYERLNEFTGPLFARLASEKYRALYRNLGADKALLALGVSYQDEPIGAIIAEMYEDYPATILDIQVASAFRGAGVGLELLARMEKAVQSRGWKEIRIYYHADWPSASVLEKMLAQRQWPTPVACQYFYESDQNIANAEWMKSYKLPANFTVFPWGTLTADERWLIEERQRVTNWFPWSLWPFIDGKPHAETSFGLRRNGEVVGWCVTELVKPDTLEYHALFVSPDLPFLPRSVPLLAKAIHTQIAMGIYKGSWSVMAYNIPMLKFVERRMAPYITYRTEERKSVKALGVMPSGK